MKKITSFLFSIGALLSVSSIQAQEVLPEGMTAISSSATLELTVKDDANRAKNEKPMVKLPNGSLVFTATASATGEELYICTNDQISLIKDIVPGSTGSNPKWLTVVGDKVFFAATTAEAGEELWITDGTENGTNMVKDIWEGDLGSELFGLTAFQGKCLFFARDEDSDLDPIIDPQSAEEWLWISDGTEAGTQRLANVPTRKGIDGMSGYLVPSGDKVFFTGYHPDYNETLWVTDGTAAGTNAIKDIYPVATSGRFQTEAAVIDWLTSVKNDVNNVHVIFRANTLNDLNEKIGSEIWISDGTAAGTKWIGVDYNPGSTEGVPNNTEFAFPIYYDGKVYFRAKDGIHGCEPGVTDFTAAGTHYVCDINFWDNDPIHDSWAPEFPYIWKGYLFAQANGSYYYPADTYHDSGYCLWRYNLAEGGETPTAQNGLTGFQYQSNWTENGKEIYPDNNSDEPRWFTACGGRLFFRAQDTGGNNELWQMESVDDTPTKVSDMEGDSKPHNLTTVGTSLYFVTTTTKTLYKYAPEPLEVTGIEDVEKDAKAFFVYPNPAVDQVTITSQAELSGVDVIDLTGKYVISQSGKNTTINVSDLTSGMYIVRATTVNGDVLTTKFTK